jgi:hypothetical protein
LAGVLKANTAVAERTLPAPAHLFRRFAGPAVISTAAMLLAASLSVILRRALRPQLPRMSDAWMRSHDAEFDRHDPWREY